MTLFSIKITTILSLQPIAGSTSLVHGITNLRIFFILPPKDAHQGCRQDQTIRYPNQRVLRSQTEEVHHSHRVVLNNKSLGLYRGGREMHEDLIELEREPRD